MSKQSGEAGIQIKDLYWTIGPFDLVARVEAPDDESLTSSLLALGAQGQPAVDDHARFRGRGVRN